jgi:glycogen(starch) synthase
VSSNAYYALKSRELRRRPLVVTLQGELTMDANQLFERCEWAQETLRRSLQQADVVTGCSTKTVRDGEHFLGEKLRAARTIFNAARLDDFASARPWQHPRPYVFALGRLVPQKGFDLLLEAFAEAAISDHDLLIAGDGPERSLLESLVEKYRLTGRVTLLGRADRPKVASLFLGCSFFVLPSRADEGLPVVCAEAMAAGKAVLAARSGGTPEAVLHGESGLIFERGDRAGLIEGLRTLGSDAVLRERFGRAGASRAPLFAWSNVTSQYLAAYEEATAAAQRIGSRESSRDCVAVPIPSVSA